VKLAIISDVHGNLHALDAVLDDIQRHSVDATLSLGDFFSGPFDPAGVADRLMALDLPTVRGNHDRYLADGRDDDWHIDAYVRGLLEPRHLDWIRALPATLVFNETVLLTHGTPRSDTIGWLDGMVDGNSVLMSHSHIEREAEGRAYDLMLCGHTHVARHVVLADGRSVVNPGSAGLPFDSGSPGAHYAIVEKRRSGWDVSLKDIPYDRQAAAALAMERGFPKWGEVASSAWLKPHEL
jgi:predicted phosphodiesterase